MSAADAKPLSTLSMNDLKQHPEFWFDDGSIVLVAQDTGFRVYRGLLALQSTVFADMLAASNPSPGETVDGCPVIPLGDSPHDLVHLRVLLPASLVHYDISDPNQPHSFETISAVIRLADKYHIQSVQDHALRALQRYHFTSNFDAFSGPPDLAIAVKPIHAIGAVNLARLTNTPRMLPLALYQCCRLDNEALLAGWTRADGTVEHLTPEDFERCSAARASLVALYTSLHTQAFRTMHSSPGCSSDPDCAWFSGSVTGLLPSGSQLLDAQRRVACDVLRDGVRLLGGLACRLRRDPCRRCVGELVRKMWVVRRRLWDALPEIFGVDVEGWKSPQAPGPQGAAGAA